MLIIKKLRLQRGWSQAELAEFSGLSVRTIQRIEKGETPGLESRKSLAAVFDLDAGDFQEENLMEDGLSVTPEEEKAMGEVRKLKGFYSHLITYVLVIAILFAVNLLADPGYIWAFWPALGWGLGILSHALGAGIFGGFSFFGPEWEKRQVEKKLGRKL